MKYIKYSTVLLVSASYLFTGCGGDGNNDSDGSQEVDSIAMSITDEDISEAQQVFYAMPSPFEVSALLKDAGADFNPSVLNPADNLSSYSTSKKKGLNLGIYGADLSYASMFEQTQSSMVYMSCVKKLTDDLGISKAFSPEIMQRLEKNKDNRDSIQATVSESYVIANAYLKQNDRASVSALVLAGGWVEGLYIATQSINVENPNQELMNMVAEQQFSLENLVAMLEGYDDPEVKEVLSDMKALMELYNKAGSEATAEATKAEEKTNESGKKMMVIGGGPDLTITPELLTEIKTKVAEIRNKYIQ